MKGGELSAGISSGQKCLDVDFLFTKLPRKSGSIGKIMDVPMEAPSCGIATQAVYAGVISSFLYGCLTNKKLNHQSCGCAVECCEYADHIRRLWGAKWHSVWILTLNASMAINPRVLAGSCCI